MGIYNKDSLMIPSCPQRMLNLLANLQRLGILLGVQESEITYYLSVQCIACAHIDVL